MNHIIESVFWGFFKDGGYMTLQSPVSKCYLYIQNQGKIFNSSCLTIVFLYLCKFFPMETASSFCYTTFKTCLVGMWLAQSSERNLVGQKQRTVQVILSKCVNKEFNIESKEQGNHTAFIHNLPYRSINLTPKRFNSIKAWFISQLIS